MTIRHMEILKTIAETGSFTKAAGFCISPSLPYPTPCGSWRKKAEPFFLTDFLKV